MALRIHLVRHGETEQSKTGVMCGSGTDAALTEEGLVMAERAAEKLSIVSWVGIFCSPLTRTRQTAAPLEQKLGRAVVLEAAVREIGYGEWEGRTPSMIEKEYPEEYRRWVEDPAQYGPVGGESGQQILNRSMAFIEGLRSDYSEGDIVVFSHKATIRILLCGYLGIPLKEFRRAIDCQVCSRAILEFTSQRAMLLSHGEKLG